LYKINLSPLNPVLCCKAIFRVGEIGRGLEEGSCTQ